MISDELFLASMPLIMATGIGLMTAICFLGIVFPKDKQSEKWATNYFIICSLMLLGISFKDPFLPLLAFLFMLHKEEQKYKPKRKRKSRF